MPKLIDAGIKSFKIEGRMKRPEYVGEVVKAYRQAIDYYFDQKNYTPNILQMKKYLIEDLHRISISRLS